MQKDQQNDVMIEIWQFRLSLYPEKVRWALDYKGIPHILHSWLPGLHIAYMLLRTGQRTVPVMMRGHEMVKGSAAVIDDIEHHFPDRPLYPQDPALRQRAIELQQWFDDVGVDVRRAFFYEFLPVTDYAADLFSIGYSAWVRQTYRAVFPLTRMIMRADMRITLENAEQGCRRIQEALDFVVQHRGKQGYLVGDTFSIADLTAAVVLFPVVLPEQYPVHFPTPYPSNIERWLARWSTHPGTLWVRKIYQQHRGQCCASKDLNT